MKVRRVAFVSGLLLVSASGCSTCKKDDPQKSSAPATSASTESAKDEPAANPKGPPTSHLGALSSAKNPYKDWKLAKDAFSFQNYGPGMADLSPAELRRMCGDAACADLDGDTCVLQPQVDQMMTELNKMVAGGHCEGMAILTLLLQRGIIDPARFGAKTGSALDLKDNAALQRELAYWWATQMMEPVAPTRNELMAKQTPKSIVEAMRKAVENDEPQTLAFWKRDRTAGHATTPYAVVDKEDGVVWILHYDNNYPGEERHIEVDTKADTWKYTTSADPNQPEPDDYDGDGETHSIALVPLAPRLEKPACVGMGDVDDTGATGSVAMRAIFLDGKGDLLITDDGGHHLGWFGGKLVSEIPGAYYSVMPTAAAKKDEEPVYFVPPGKPLTLTLDGAGLSADETSDVTLIGPGYTLAVEDIDLAPNEKDALDVAGDWSSVSYATDTKETPTLRIGISTKGPDYEIAVKASGEKAGQKLTLGVDLAKGTFVLMVHGGDGSTDYSVELQRIDDKGKVVFSHKGLAAGDDQAVAFDYASWKGNKEPMHVTVGGTASDVPDDE